MNKRKIILGVSLLSIALLALGLKQSSTKGFVGTRKKNKQKITWNSFDKGTELARKENKFLVVDFYTDWCHWCKVMDKETYGNIDVIKYAQKNVVMAKINAETKEKFRFKNAFYTGRELTMMFGVRGFPATVFLDSKGDFITLVSGFIQADEFNFILKYLSENWYEKMEFDEFLKKEKGNKNKS